MQSCGQGTGEPLTLRGDNSDVDKHILAFCAPLQNGETLIGYYGFLVDKTHEQALKDRLDILTLDVGQVLHTTSTTTMMAAQALKLTLEFLSRQKGATLSALLSDEGKVAYSWLPQDAERLAKALERLLEEGQSNAYKQQALLPQQWDLLRAQITKLRTPKTVEHRALKHTQQPGFLRLIIATVRDTLRRAKPQHLSRQSIRAVEQACDALELSTLLAPLVSTYLSLLLLEKPLNALRDFITSQVRPEEPTEKLLLSEIIKEAVEELKEFANSRQIEVRLELICSHAYVKASRRELRRALMNVIHNAIKYTIPRTRGRPSWVTVQLTCLSTCEAQYGPCAEIMVENWGTGIPEDEITSGAIFELGYRGRLATGRTAMGTGIGLTDTRHVLRHLGGSIHLESHPARDIYPKNDPAYFNQPFLTKVFIRLPLAPP